MHLGLFLELAVALMATLWLCASIATLKRLRRRLLHG